MSAAASASISVTQALAELKLLRRRVDNALEDAKFICLKKKRDLLDVARFSADATASYQSYQDLVSRYNKLKAAIVQSNAIACVTIGDKTYTVADAVERKRNLGMEKVFLSTLQEQYREVQEAMKAHQAQEQARVERLLQVELGKDSKTNVETIQSLTDTFLAQNKAEIVDPLNLADKITALNRNIEEFETKVDWVLSESNGRTLITL
jgi:predicted transposase YbfD/YdcC